MVTITRCFEFLSVIVITVYQLLDCIMLVIATQVELVKIHCDWLEDRLEVSVTLNTDAGRQYDQMTSDIKNQFKAELRLAMKKTLQAGMTRILTERAVDRVTVEQIIRDELTNVPVYEGDSEEEYAMCDIIESDSDDDATNN